MCVLHLFIYMLWGSRKNEGELVSLVLQGDLWRVGVISSVRSLSFPAILPSR